MTSDSDATYREALAVAMKMLRTSDRTESEVRGRLAAKGFMEDVADRVVTYLQTKKFLDDTRVAERAAEQAHKTRLIGREKLKWELENRGVDEVLVEGAIAGSSEESELAKAMVILQRRFTPKDRIDRAARHLASKGFEEDVVRSALESFFGPLDE